jgi:hypothetical protein
MENDVAGGLWPVAGAAGGANAGFGPRTTDN